MALGFLYGAGGGGSQPEPESKALIPTMTSDTTPSGVCFSSGAGSNTYAAWKAFDNSTSTYFLTPDNVAHAYIGYMANSPWVAKYLTYKSLNSGYDGSAAISIKVQGSHDGSTWDDLSNEVTLVGTSSGTIDFGANKTAYSSYRIYKTAGNRGMAVQEIQIYGYERI